MSPVGDEFEEYFSHGMPVRRPVLFLFVISKTLSEKFCCPHFNKIGLDNLIDLWYNTGRIFQTVDEEQVASAWTFRKPVDDANRYDVQK